MKTEEFDIVIEKGRTEVNYWKDLIRFRELFYILSWRDIKVRYKQTVIGAAWAILRPFLTMLILTFVFARLAKLPAADGTPYSLMVLTGWLPWQFFSTSLGDASNSLIGNVNLITKVYFPRLIIPASSVITSFVDFLIAFVLLMAVMAYNQFAPNINIIFLPVFLILIFLLSFGFGIFLTALNVKYRDFRYVLPFITQFGMYLSPVGYSSTIVPEKWQLLYSFNPLVGVIEGFRWCILGRGEFPAIPLLISTIITIVVVIMGVLYFRKTEKTFADSI